MSAAKWVTEKGWWSLITAKNKLTVYPKLTGMKGWHPAFYWLEVSANFPLRRHFTKPVIRMEDIPWYGLSAVKMAAFDYFEFEVGTLVIDGGDDAEGRIPYTQLPNACSWE